MDGIRLVSVAVCNGILIIYPVNKLAIEYNWTQHGLFTSTVQWYIVSNRLSREISLSPWAAVKCLQCQPAAFLM